MLQTVSITVSGKVQGVFYRQSTREKADELGLTGRVWNLPNGDVGIIATGTKDGLNKLIEWCRKGPARAVVANVEYHELDMQAFTSFSIDRA